MKTWRHQASRILRGNDNAHRFVCFINGKIRIFSTSLDDINSQVAELFGHLNACRALNNPARLAQALLLALTCAGLPAAALALDPLALPTGYQSVSGNVQFSQSPGVLNVTTGADRSIVNYQSFNVGSQASVNFMLPSSHASILNRVTGGNMSEIYGNITSNGKVFLVNPAGIFFGNGANISVNGLVASTLNITDHNFLNGRYEFSRVPGAIPAGIRVDDGAKINVQNGGSATFLASSFLNNGTITAPGGTLQIGIGDRIALGNDLVGLTVTESLQDTLNQAAVVNNGTLSAEQVRILASVVKDSFQGAIINNTGYIRANKLVDGEGGTIELIADNGAVHNTGLVDASGSQGGHIRLLGSDSLNSGQLLATGNTGTGGTIEVLGTNSVALTGNAMLNASGATGGGTILVGGDRQGLNPEIPNAQTAFVGSGARLLADAMTHGNGGKVILWSDRVTGFDGSISARGMGLGSLGGFVETSGKEALEIGSGRVDASSALGQGGQWLLDPLNVTITNSTNNITSSFDGLSGTWTHTPNNGLPGTSLISAALINNALNLGTNVTINTGTIGADSGNITVDSAISKTAGADATLSLLAANDIQLNQAISASSNKLNVILRADHDISAAPTADGAGSVTLNAGITTNGGNVTLSGAAINLQHNLDAVSGTITATAANGSISQTAGNIRANTISLTATGGDITQTGGTLSTQALNAQTTGSGNQITLIDTDSNQANLQTNNGNIALTDRDGLSVRAAAGTGTVNITADAGSLLLHSNNGVAGAGINLTGNNSGSTFNLLTYHGGISQDIGSTIAGTTLNAESQDQAHSGIALSDADFQTATFKTNNGQVNYKDKDGVTATVQAGSGDASITTANTWLGSNNGNAENDLIITGANTAKNLTYTALQGDIRQAAGTVFTTNLLAQANNGNITQTGGGMSASQALTLLTNTGNITHSGGSLGANTLHVYSSSGNIALSDGSIDALTTQIASNAGNVSFSGGTLNSTTLAITANNSGSITLGGGLIQSNQADIHTFAGNITQNAGTVKAGSQLNITSQTGTITLNNGNLDANSLNIFTASGDILRNNGNIDANTATLASQSGNITYNDGHLHAASASLVTDSGSVTVNGGHIGATNIALNTLSGDLTQNGGLLQAGNLLELTSQSGKITQNNGLMVAGTAHWYTGSGAILRNNGLLSAVNASLATDTGSITYNDGSLDAVNVNLLGNNSSPVTINGGTITGNTVNLITQAGDITQTGGSILAGDTANVLTNGGSIVQSNGSILGDKLNLAANNGNISISGSLLANQSIRLTTSNTVPFPAGNINIGPTGTVSAPIGSIYVNTNQLTLDGQINGKLVQIWPWDLNLAMNIGASGLSGLTISQAMLGHINTNPGLGLNTIMFGHQNYQGTVTLGSADFSSHLLTDVVLNAPRVFENTPTSDPSGSFNLKLANDRSVFFTAGAATPSDWNTAPGGISFGDNAVLAADLDVQVSGTGTINVNLQGSAPANAPSFAVVNGVGNKAFINVSEPSLFISNFTIDGGVGTFRNFASLLNPKKETLIQNQIKGNTITLSGSKLTNIFNIYGLQVPVPFVTNISL